MRTQRLTTYANSKPSQNAQQLPGLLQWPEATRPAPAPSSPTRFHTHTRNGTSHLEAPFEKPVVLAGLANCAPRDLLWADALFASDILAEHAQFFALLIPKEVAHEANMEALLFHDQFKHLHQTIVIDGPPAESDLTSYVDHLREAMQPFIDYKQDCHRAQVRGELRSLAWPLFFDHTRREAQRWLARMDDIAAGHPLERREVVAFGCDIMEEHGKLIGHLLDPDEVPLLRKTTRRSNEFRDLHPPSGRRLANLLPGARPIGLSDQELDFVLAAAESVLDFKTETARGIETARIRSIIHPRLADHMRREAVKFVDELHRTRRS